jgi:hypothetical protein
MTSVLGILPARLGLLEPTPAKISARTVTARIFAPTGAHGKWRSGAPRVFAETSTRRPNTSPALQIQDFHHMREYQSAYGTTWALSTGSR